MSPWLLATLRILQSALIVVIAQFHTWKWRPNVNLYVRHQSAFLMAQAGWVVTRDFATKLAVVNLWIRGQFKKTFCSFVFCSSAQECRWLKLCLIPPLRRTRTHQKTKHFPIWEQIGHRNFREAEQRLTMLAVA